MKAKIKNCSVKLVTLSIALLTLMLFGTVSFAYASSNVEQRALRLEHQVDDYRYDPHHRSELHADCVIQPGNLYDATGYFNNIVGEGNIYWWDNLGPSIDDGEGYAIITGTARLKAGPELIARSDLELRY